MPVGIEVDSRIHFGRFKATIDFPIAEMGNALGQIEFLHVVNMTED